MNSSKITLGTGGAGGRARVVAPGPGVYSPRALSGGRTSTEATARKLEIGSAAIPEAQASLPPTPRAELDQAIAVLARTKDEWVALGLPERIALLREMIGTTEAVGAPLRKTARL